MPAIRHSEGSLPLLWVTVRGPSGEEGYFAGKKAAFLKTNTSAAKEKIDPKAGKVEDY